VFWAGVAVNAFFPILEGVFGIMFFMSGEKTKVYNHKYGTGTAAAVIGALVA
jgi:hypothetical protein